MLAAAFPERLVLGLGVGYPHQAAATGQEFGKPVTAMRGAGLTRRNVSGVCYAQAMPESDVHVFPANQASWDDLQAVFGRGTAAKCQCQRIKLGDHDWFAMPVEERAQRLREEADCGHPEADKTSGMVAYVDGVPAGWVAVEPRANYRRLRGSSVPWAGRTEDPDDPDVWAIVCFAIRPGYRGQGLTRPLTAAAVEYARTRGAKAVEGYPMIPRPGQTVSWGEMNVGSRSTFVAAGFRDVSRPTTRRAVMRLDLD